VFASRIKSEKTFIAVPVQERSTQNSANFQMREDEKLRSMIMNNTSTEYIYIFFLFRIFLLIHFILTYKLYNR